MVRFLSYAHYMLMGSRIDTDSTPVSGRWKYILAIYAAWLGTKPEMGFPGERVLSSRMYRTAGP
jgi:hypothetical protein